MQFKDMQTCHLAWSAACEAILAACIYLIMGIKQGRNHTWCIATRSENMLKYWAKSKFFLLHLSTQQKIVAPTRVWPAYSQTLPK